MKNKRLHIFLTLGIAFIYLLIVSLQGFDLCDEGFYLSFYQQFFNNPNSASYQFMFYLTGLFGGIWNTIFGWGGIFSFRLLNVLVILLTAHITYKVTEDYINSKIFLVATFLVILLNNFGNMVVNYNYFTALLVSISVLFLLNGINKNKKWLLFFGGFFIGLSFFARVPNITMLSLGSLLIINLFYLKDWRLFRNSILFLVLGCFTAILITILAMIQMGHFNIFVDSVSENILSLGIEKDSNHNLGRMMIAYLYSYIVISRFLVLYFFLFAGFVFSFKFFKTKRVRVILSVLMLLLFLAQQNMSSISNYYAFILFPILISSFVDYRNKSIMLLNAASLLIMFCLPLGSDFGITGNMGVSSLWLGTFVALGHYNRVVMHKIQKNDYSILVFLGITIFTFLSINFYKVSMSAYFDSGSRIEKRFSIENNLANVYTSQTKSLIMNELLGELDKYVVAGDTMLCFESLPTIQYLTQTIPFVGTSWVWVYDSNSFKINLLRAENSTNYKPVVLRQKTQPIGGNWTSFDIRYNDTVSEDNYIYKKQRIIIFNEFLNRNDYQIAWENDLFQILTVKTD